MNERVMVVLNKSNDKQTYKLNMPKFYSARELIYLQTGEITKSSNIDIPAWGWKMFVIK